MNQSIIVIRSIASEFARRLFNPVFIIYIIVIVVASALIIWLLTISAWWWLLAVPVFLVMLAGLVLLAIARVVIGVVAPQQTKHQKKQVGLFVDKLQRLSEITQTPKFILLFRTVKAAISPGKTSYIQSVVGETTSLKKDYQELLTLFAK